MRRRVLSGLLVVAALTLLSARPTQAAKKLGGRVDAADVHVTSSPTLAVIHYYETNENVIDGKPQPVNIRATTTFRKEGGQWKVIGHHTDTLAYLQKK